MNNYNSYVGKIAEGLQSSNMQRHMGSMTNDVSPERAKILENIINYEKENFVRLVYETALGNREKYQDGRVLNDYFIGNENDLVTIFTKMNEDSLDDPEFSNAIVNKTLYAKKIGCEERDIYFYNHSGIGSIKHLVTMDLLFIPSAELDVPNKFRIDVKEYLAEKNKYPYLNFSVDIGDDGSINYNEVVVIGKDNAGNITKNMADISMGHVKFNENNLPAIRDVFMNIFEKTGIKEDVSSKHH